MYKIHLSGLMLFLSGGIMASSLPLPVVDGLAGHWILENSPHRCEIILTSQPIPETGSFALSTVNTDCNSILPSDIVAWRPAPDGIELTDINGRIKIFLAGYNTNFEHHVPEKGLLKLMKK